MTDGRSSTHRRAGLALACLALLCAASPCSGARSDRAAVRTARRVMRALGGQRAYEDTRLIAWTFFDRRVLAWDRSTGDLRVQSSDGLTVLMDLDDRTGRAFKEGAELTGDALGEALELGYRAWINDGYWLLMPYKLLDPGVRLRDLGGGRSPEGAPCRVLELTFDGVGLTPQNKYHVHVDEESDLVVGWSFFREASDAEPAFTLPIGGWVREGGILLPTDHGRGDPWEVVVLDAVPEGLFSSPAPVSIASLRAFGESRGE